MAAIMGTELFKKNAKTAFRAIITVLGADALKDNATPEQKATFRAAWVDEMVEMFDGKVKSADVVQRYSTLKPTGGMPVIPAGVRGRKVDKAAIAEDTANEVAELRAMGLDAYLDENGNVAVR